MATRMLRMLTLVATLSVLFLTALDCPADPSFKVTVGSEFSIAAADLGLTAFVGRTRVFLRNGRRIVTVPSKVVRSGDSAGKALNCTWKAKLAPGRYALLVETDDADGTKVVLTDFFTTFKAEHLGKTLALSAGDLLTAYPKTAYDPAWARDLYSADPETHDVAMMEPLATMPFDAVALGNHDPCLGLARLLELHSTYSVPFLVANLFRFQNGGYTPWNNLTNPPLPTSRSFQLKGIDVGVVAAAATVQDHWTDADKSEFRVVKILWDNADRTVDTVQLIEGNWDGDGKYLGCADDQMAVVDDGGLIQELAEDPWDPLVDSRWWEMEDWITASESPSPRQKLRPPLTK